MSFQPYAAAGAPGYLFLARMDGRHCREDGRRGRANARAAESTLAQRLLYGLVYFFHLQSARNAGRRKTPLLRWVKLIEFHDLGDRTDEAVALVAHRSGSVETHFL